MVRPMLLRTQTSQMVATVDQVVAVQVLRQVQAALALLVKDTLEVRVRGLTQPQVVVAELEESEVVHLVQPLVAEELGVLTHGQVQLGPLLVVVAALLAAVEPQDLGLLVAELGLLAMEAQTLAAQAQTPALVVAGQLAEAAQVLVVADLEL